MRKLLLAGGFLILSFGAANAMATDCSGTIATANTPVTLILNPTPVPSIVLLQNIDDREVMWFSFGAIVPQSKGLGSFVVPPARTGAFAASSMLFLTFPASGAPLNKLSVVAATAGHRVSCAYW